MTTDKQILTVSELSWQVKTLLEGNFGIIWVEGEVSNVKYHTSGHIYFSLKDEKASINAIIWGGQSGFLKFKLENGLKIIAQCKLTSYPARSQYQVVVSNASPAGLGALQLAFEQLKKKLAAEGLFDIGRKKKIPVLPRRVAVVTSPTGAAIKDILSVIKRRFSNLEVLIYPARVQGAEAKDEVVEAISDLNKHFSEIEVIILSRGGGSMEDLWVFNEEIVARAIAGSGIPVISAIGHEVDFTISDFVADERAPTPSAAAEMVVKRKDEFSDKIDMLTQRMHNYFSAKMEALSAKVNFLVSSRYFTQPFSFIEERIQEIDDLKDRLKTNLSHLTEVATYKFEKQIEKLELLSPLASLARGYSVVWKMPEKKIILKAGEVKQGQDILVKVSKGEISAKVTKTED